VNSGLLPHETDLKLTCNRTNGRKNRFERKLVSQRHVVIGHWTACD